MSEEERTFLQSPEGIALVEAHLEEDPVEFVLTQQKKPADGQKIPLSAVATQIKYLQRAKGKLPSWYAARCLLPPRAFEQASSENAAQLKPFGQGSRALDLTCGLGVDTHALAQHFTQVVALEENPALAAVTAWNLDRLGCHNIDLQHSSAETFLREYDGPPFDLVFLDPDRRDQGGKRKFALSDCRPDVLQLREQLTRIGKRVMVKLSPMLDLTELRRQLDPVDRITVVAIGHECKEILVELGQEGDTRFAVACQRGERTYRFEDRPSEVHLPTAEPEIGGYVYELDIAFYKAGLTANWWASTYPYLTGGGNHPDGYYFSITRLGEFPGRLYQVEAIWPYQPGKLKKALRAAGHDRINYSRRWFDLPLKKVKQQLGIKEGGEAYLLFTQTVERKRIAMLVRRLS